ncbi:MAG: hypothetical protein ABH883_03625, partial [Candidatus Omnitrophota bacterium]
MKELKELLKFIMGFMPWILFLFLAGHTLAGLERAIVICLLASLIFGFRQLRKGFVLQWGTLLFFACCAIVINFMKVTVFAKHMGIIVNGFLASIIWITILVGKPFTLQYARAELPKERWNDPRLVQGCRFMAMIWGILLTFSTIVACFRALNPGL